MRHDTGIHSPASTGLTSTSMYASGEYWVSVSRAAKGFGDASVELRTTVGGEDLARSPREGPKVTPGCFLFPLPRARKIGGASVLEVRVSD